MLQQDFSLISENLIKNKKVIFPVKKKTNFLQSCKLKSYVAFYQQPKANNTKYKKSPFYCYKLVMCCERIQAQGQDQ